MSMHRSLAAGLWLVAAVGAYAVISCWADDAHRGKIHPWALVALFWGVAAVSVAIHHLSRYLAACLEEGAVSLRLHWARLRPALAGHAAGAADALAVGAAALRQTLAARLGPMAADHLQRLSERLAGWAQVLKRVQRSWVEHKPVIHPVRGLVDLVEVAHGALKLRRYWARGKAAAG